MTTDIYIILCKYLLYCYKSNWSTLQASEFHHINNQHLYQTAYFAKFVSLNKIEVPKNIIYLLIISHVRFYRVKVVHEQWASVLKCTLCLKQVFIYLFNNVTIHSVIPWVADQSCRVPAETVGSLVLCVRSVKNNKQTFEERFTDVFWNPETWHPTNSTSWRIV